MQAMISKSCLFANAYATLRRSAYEENFALKSVGEKV